MFIYIAILLVMLTVSQEILCKQDSINSPIVGIIEMTVQVDPKIIKRFVDMMKKVCF